MEKGLVSIIIPTHKGIENIIRAVESALNQTYKNIEVIVVDDNGLGEEEQIKTQAAMSKFAEYENVKYIPHEININASAARNTGIRNSNGEYIAFLDDDDEYLPDNIEQHMRILSKKSDEYAISYCGKNLIVPGIKQQIIMPPCEGNVLFDFLCGKIRIGSSFILVKRNVVEEINGFDESFRRHQDWEFIVRILDKYKIAKVEYVGINKYNIGRNQAKNPQKYEENRLYYLNKIDYIIKKFDEKQQTQIYDSHYFQISKEYLRVKDLKKFMKWINKTSNPVKYYFRCFTSYFDYLRRNKAQ